MTLQMKAPKPRGKYFKRWTKYEDEYGLMNWDSHRAVTKHKVIYARISEGERSGGYVAYIMENPLSDSARRIMKLGFANTLSEAKLACDGWMEVWYGHVINP